MKNYLSGESRSRTAQRGLTLLELMVALTISLIVVLAALAALLFARDGFSTVDTSSQLRENARFATTLITRVVQQAGYQEWSESNGSVQRADVLALGLPVDPDIQGFNNAVFNAGSPTNGSRPASCGTSTDTNCLNGSDVLVIRYQGRNNSSGTAADGSMIDCAGSAQAAIVNVNNIGSRSISYFYVDVSSGEPSLMCAAPDPSTGTLTSYPLMQGVESFQVLYGTYLVTANTAPVALPSPPAQGITQWLRADQMVVTGDAASTSQNWQRVRAVRVGIVLRSLPGQSGTKTSGSNNYVYPFVDSSVPFTNDYGVKLSVPFDRRVRQSFTFTINLRNSLL